ncbi:MAG: peptide chain release factor N(5)-glutamine methyltransferase [Schleiferiaceae bacterium]|nr:peptide chain release factor N(5)-glutamine methyltransferase [Schleiferiaceae bacterium]
MHTLQRIYREKLAPLYPPKEIDIHFKWLVMERMNWTSVQFMLNRNSSLPKVAVAQLKNDLERLLCGEPIQYILGFTEFFGFRFVARPGCLIPRPETEELVLRVLQYAEAHTTEPSVLLDVGTGSGCIGLSLAKIFPSSTVHCVDYSDAALAIAKENAEILQVKNVIFHKLDFLDATTWHQLPKIDWVVSNPPYIPENDKASMHINVLGHEPHEALFVPNDNLLLFYDALLEFCNYNGASLLFAEIYERATAALTQSLTIPFAIHKDLQGKDRILEMKISPVITHETNP